MVSAMVLLSSGKRFVVMAVRTGRNFFVPEKNANDPESVRKNLQENLRRMLDIIDEANPAAAITVQKEEA